ncbi:hypothetical protein [Burkholderia ubonensis]|nr:hypothetical protein [Burkholderia ubonensis]
MKPGERGEVMYPREENDFKFAGYNEVVNSENGRHFGFSIGCSDRIEDKNEIAKEHGGSYDDKKKRWAAYYVDDRDRKLLAPVTRIYSLASLNGDGFVRVTDDIVGEPSQRTRALSYCLFHDNKAICGEGQVMRLTEPKYNFLPAALKVLRSVQFVDDHSRDQTIDTLPDATGASAPVEK